MRNNMSLIEKYYSHLSGLTDECQYTMKHIEDATRDYNLLVVSSLSDKINIVNNGYITGLLNGYLKSRGMKTRVRGLDKDIIKAIKRMENDKNVSGQREECEEQVLEKNETKDEYVTVLEYRKEEKKKISDKLPYLLGRLAMSKICVFKEEVEKSVINVVEAARKSYSTFNNQPWRIVAYNNRIHIFCKEERDFLDKQMHEAKLRDIGIALADMEMAAEEEWLMAEYEISEKISDKKVKNHEYVITMFLNRTV